MEYNLKEHGDHLEKEYSGFIKEHFSTYEAVWKIYIGNKGNDTKADILGYSFAREQQRQEFSEHTYTILQSVILLNRIVESDAFNKGVINSTSGILDLQDNLILFFSHLGRIRDNVLAASTCLNSQNVKNIEKILDEFYYKRHILVHGKMIPIIFKSNGDISIPLLSKNSEDILAWDHQRSKWQDVVFLPTETVNSTVSQLYWDLLPKVKEIFGMFKNEIQNELRFANLEINFENKDYPDMNLHGSGSTSAGVASIYGIKDINRPKW